MIIDLSKARDQRSYEVIPDKTAVKFKLSIKHGFYNDREKSWLGNWATKSDKTGSIYLNAKLTVAEGEYKGRQVYKMIGLHSEKGPTWTEMGRTDMKAIMQSAHNIDPADTTPLSLQKLALKDFGELDGLEFAGVVSVTVDNKGNDRNELNYIITPDDARYSSLMGAAANVVAAKDPDLEEENIQRHCTPRECNLRTSDRCCPPDEPQQHQYCRCW